MRSYNYMSASKVYGENSIFEQSLLMSACTTVWGNGTNQSLSFLVEFERDLHHLKLLAYGIICPIVIGFGIVGNLLNLVVLTRPTLQGITFTYLFALAISDLLTLVFGATSLLRLLDIQPRTYIAAVYFSHVELPLVNAFMASSVFLVVCVTIDRYFSICHPTNFKDIHNPQCARKLIVCAYALAFTIYIPVCFEKLPIAWKNHLNFEYLACENPWIVHNFIFNTYLTIKESIVRLGPVLLLVFLNLNMIFTLHKRRQQIRCHSSSFRKKIRDEHRLFMLLAAIVVLFFACTMPAAVLTLLHSEEKDLHYDFQVFRAVANVLEFANFSMNFYIYCFCSPEFRSTFFTFFTKRTSPTIMV